MVGFPIAGDPLGKVGVELGACGQPVMNSHHAHFSPQVEVLLVVNHWHL